MLVVQLRRLHQRVREDELVDASGRGLEELELVPGEDERLILVWDAERDPKPFRLRGQAEPLIMTRTSSRRCSNIRGQVGRRSFPKVVQLRRP